MQHPVNFLLHDNTLHEEHVGLLFANCDRHSPHPDDPSRTVFTFSARRVNDVRDRTIDADIANGRYTADRSADCVCDQVRPDITCECWNASCHYCGLTFVAVQHACDSEYCLYDECKLCLHQRETCDFEEIERRVETARQSSVRQYPEETVASHAYAAVTAVLGGGSGEAPSFPAVRRILGRIMQVNPDDENVWFAPDGSTLRVDRRNSAWIETPYR